MNRPAAVEISYDCMTFLITHNPTNATLNKFTEVCSSSSVLVCVFIYKRCQTLCLLVRQDLKKFKVNTLVRVCEATYDKTPVEKEGIHVLVRMAI